MASTPAPSAQTGKKEFAKQFFLALLVIVVATLFLLIAMVPRWWWGHPRSAPESSAAARTRYLTDAEMQYKSTYGHYAFDLKVLAGSYKQCPENPTSAHACLVDFTAANSSASSLMNGYYYKADPGPSADTFVMWGIPVSSDHRFFCATDDGILRLSTTEAGESYTSYAACKVLRPLGD